jgi:hypothetical protein
LHRLTDDTGIIQHSIFTVPNYSEGYCTDDNSRALLVTTQLECLGNKTAAELGSRYLAFIWYAFDEKTSKFRNFMDYQRNWLEKSGSDDSQGRTLWALGTLLGRSSSMAGWLFEQALPSILKTTSPRAWAFTIIGIQEYLHRFAGERRANQIREELSRRLLELYQNNRTDEWCWYEDSLTYCNGVLPHAMLKCGHSIQNSDMIEAGLESLNWLAELTRSEEGYFMPIGSNGFYQKGGTQARFDQQPVEAQAMVSACLEAFRVTGDMRWRKEARRAFEWFLGRNDLNSTVYDPTTGGCRDGIHPDRLNENQGAESTLAFLQALLELKLDETNLITKDSPCK